MSIWVKNSKILLTPQWGREPTFTPPFSPHDCACNNDTIAKGYAGSVEKYWWHRNKKHKKQPFSDASASHLSLVLWHV